MKTLLYLATTALLMGAAIPALATPPPPANLAVFSETGQPFSLVLDGRLLTRPAAPQVRVGWLTPGRHYADISLPTPYGPPMSFRTVVWLQPGRESSYMVVVRRWGPELQQVAAPPAAGGYYGNQSGPGGYPAPAAPGGGYNSNSYPAPTGPGGSYPGPGSPSGGYNSNGGYPAPAGPGGGYNPGGNYPAPATPNSGYPAPGSPAGSYPAYPGSGNGYYPGTTTPGLQPLAPVEVANLLQAVRRASFDSAKLAVAKQGLTQSSVRAEELAALVKALSFSDARVDLATFGYDHVSDPQNFYLVYSSLDFSSDVQKVRQALGLP